jgi:signal transduction histidine kinase
MPGLQGLGVVAAVARATREQYEPSELLQRICADVAAGLRLDRLQITRLETEPEGEVAVAVARHARTGELPAPRALVNGDPLLGRARKASAIVERRELRERGRAAAPASASGEAAFAVPLVVDGRCVGFMLGSRHGAGPLAASQRDVLDCVGAVVAALVEKQRLQEEAVRLNESKTQFVALATHELRTPIAAVYGILATLHAHGPHLPEEQRVELRATAFEQAEKLRQLADQLLDLSRIDAAAFRLEPKPIPVRRKLEEIALLVGARRATEIAIDAPPDLEISVDPIVIDRVVSNLLMNALRYGAPPVEIRAACRDAHLRLSVEDSGSGVPAEFEPVLFERFTRSERAVREGAEGSGLGLSIAQSYARAHGGEIVYTRGEPGARFELVIPLSQN